MSVLTAEVREATDALKIICTISKIGRRVLKQ